MTGAMKSALLWLRNRNADGVFDLAGVLMAAGERAPVMRATWKSLADLGHVERYDRQRLRVTEPGLKVDLRGVEESGPALDWDDDE